MVTQLFRPLLFGALALIFCAPSSARAVMIDAITLDSGGTLLLGASEDSTYAAGIGALTLSNDSHTLENRSPTIAIATGNEPAGDNGIADRSVFISDEGTQLSSFKLDSYVIEPSSGGSNDYEATIVTAVPEPSTYVAAALALGAVAWHQRRRLRRPRRRDSFPAK